MEATQAEQSKEGVVMKEEKNYDFLYRMREIHKADRRNCELEPVGGETVVDSSWVIAVKDSASEMVRKAAADLQDYLFTSMNVSIRIEKTVAAEKKAKQILLVTKNDFNGVLSPVPEKRGSYFFECDGENILVCGAEERGVLYGAIHIEDLMNLREAPYLKKCAYLREPLVRMRSVHSGSGIDDFPDWQLNAIVHAGFNAIDVFVKDIDTTTRGYCNINDIIERASEYGIDVVLYNYVRCYKHPDDADAEEFFDSVYGNLARHYPKARAISLVGESLEFPSKDPATTGKRCRDSVVDGIPDTRPSPGWYPCCDYPAFLNAIKRAVHKVNPEIEVIFSTYNWGWAPLEVRKKFLESFPKDITLQITFEIFKANERGDLKTPVMDYTISATEPGYYFSSEAKIAHELGLRIRATSNLAGTTWDFGCAPYVPVPQRWIRKMLNLKRYLKECGVNSFYENHHYGWWENPTLDLAKEIFFTPEHDELDGFLRLLAVRDYGGEAADKVVEAWNLWSNAMDFYVASNEDQYGPWRTGPSYPFIFQPNISRTMANKEIQFPTAPHAHFGYKIIKTLYQPYENENQSPGPLRYPVELKDLEKMLELWEKGLSVLEEALPLMPPKKRDNGDRLYALAKFMRNAVRTVIHMKNWWMLNIRLQSLSSREEMLAVLDKIEAVAKEEVQNVLDTIPCVETDSRIGWEPSMEYVCDKWHLEWKLRQMESMMLDIIAYRKMIQL